MSVYVSHSFSARGKVADHQVELIDAELLRFGDDGQRLVGGEHHGQALGAAAVPHLGNQFRRVGGDRDRDVIGVDVLGSPRHFGVRARGERAQIQLGLGGPLPQCLRQQRDRWDGEQNAGVAAVFGRGPLGDLQSREGLSGAARHDQLAAIVSLSEAVEHLLDRCCLVGARLMSGRLSHIDMQVAVDPGDVPADR